MNLLSSSLMIAMIAGVLTLSPHKVFAQYDDAIYDVQTSTNSAISEEMRTNEQRSSSSDSRGLGTGTEDIIKMKLLDSSFRSLQSHYAYNIRVDKFRGARYKGSSVTSAESMRYVIHAGPALGYAVSGILLDLVNVTPETASAMKYAGSAVAVANIIAAFARRTPKSDVEKLSRMSSDTPDLLKLRVKAAEESLHSHAVHNRIIRLTQAITSLGLAASIVPIYLHFDKSFEEYNAGLEMKEEAAPMPQVLIGTGVVTGIVGLYSLFTRHPAEEHWNAYEDLKNKTGSKDVALSQLQKASYSDLTLNTVIIANRDQTGFALHGTF